MHSFPLGLWGQRTAFVHRHSCWLLLDVGLHQGLWEAKSQNQRAFALFTTVVLNGQKITDRSCHVLPLSLAHKGTRRRFKSWRDEKSEFLLKDKSLKHTTRKLDHISDSIHTSALFYCLVWTWVSCINWHVLTLYYCLVHHKCELIARARSSNWTLVACIR